MFYLSSEADYFFEFQTEVNNVMYTSFVKFSPDENNNNIALAYISQPLLWKNPFGKELKEFCDLFYRRFENRSPYYICHINYINEISFDLTITPNDINNNLESLKTIVFRARNYNGMYVNSMKSPYKPEFVIDSPIMISPYGEYKMAEYYTLKKFVESYSAHSRFR